MTDARIVNGVDLTRVEDLKAGFLAGTSESRPAFTATVRWLGGFRTESAMTNHTLVRGDEPEEYAGGDSGPSPEDMLLAAIGQCLAVGYASATASRGIELHSLEISVSGRVNFMVAYGLTEGNPGFKRIDVEVKLVADAGADELRAIHKTVLAEAPIPNTVSRPVDLQASFTASRP